MQKVAFLISLFFCLNLQSQSWSLILDWNPQSIFIEYDTLKMIHQGKLYVFDGKKCIPSKTDLRDQLCFFDVGTLIPSYKLNHQGYRYNSIDNKLYNSCKSPSLVKEFDSDIVGMFRDSKDIMIIATREHGFYINDQNRIKSLYLPGVNNLQNINTAIFCDERIIYSNENHLYSWSQDDHVEKRIHTAHTKDLSLAVDRFKQIWVNDRSYIFKLNQYQDLTELNIDLESLNSSSSQNALQWINIDFLQLFPDLSFEYKTENNEWLSLKNNLLNIDERTESYNVSLRAFSDHSNSNVFNFTISPSKTDPIFRLMKIALAAFSVLVLGLIFLLWRQLYLRKISDQNINRLRTQRALTKTHDKLFELQMNPHFIFNSLNAIKGLVATEKPKEARRAISDFASIMRSLLDYSREEQNSIEEEVRFLKKYLALQNLTHPDVFDFEISVDDSIDQAINIPVMMIQPFIENAIIHGLLTKKEKGKIDIIFTDSDGTLVCIVKDNGVGIDERSSSQHLSHSTKIITDRISNANLNSTLEVLNLNDQNGNNRLGTQVTIPLTRLTSGI